MSGRAEHEGVQTVCIAPAAQEIPCSRLAKKPGFTGRRRSDQCNRAAGCAVFLYIAQPAREALEAESSSRAELALQLRQSHEAVTDYEAEKAELIAAREKLSGESESLRKRIGALIAEQQTLRAELSKTSASDSTSLKNEVARLKKQIESERKKTAKRRKPASPQRLKRFKRELIRPSTGISSNPSAIFPRSTFHSSSMIPSNWIGNSVLSSSNSAA